MSISYGRVSNKFFGMRDFPYLRPVIRDFKGKSGQDLGLKVYAGGGMPKVTLRIMGLPENLGRDYGKEKPYWGPSYGSHSLVPCSWGMNTLSSIVFYHINTIEL